MGKISKSTKVAKALVKRGITKTDSTISAAVVTPVNSKSTKSKPVGQTRPRLEELSEIIATAPVSRGKRKRAMKRARIISRQGFVEAALRAKRSADNKDGFGAALGDFEDMADAINDSPEEIKEPLKPVKPAKCKWQSGALKRDQKLKADRVDVERFNTLMSIPDFAADPLAAMEKHLLSVKRANDAKEGRKNHRMEAS